MMNFLSRLDSQRTSGAHAADSNCPADSYESVLTIQSKVMPAVTFVINRISFGRRMELTRRAHEISKKAEFLEAGSELQDKIGASILAQEVDAMYVTWGLVSISGLTLDGEPASAARLLEKGPDELTREIVTEIKKQFGLSDPERKN